MIDEFIHWRYGLSKIYPFFIVTYKIYLKSDYKPLVRWNPDRPWYRKPRVYIWGLTGFLVSFAATLIYTLAPTDIPTDRVSIKSSTPAARTVPVVASNIDYSSNPGDVIPDTVSPQATPEPIEETIGQSPEPEDWQTIYVAPGDNMSLIFDRLRLTPATLYQVMSASKDNTALKYLLPGQQLRFQIEDGRLIALEYDQDLLTTLRVSYEDTSFQTELIKSELHSKVREAEAVIDSSLFLAGQKAGLSDNLIMQLVSIYGWDIDFVLDIRRGDTFKIIYEEQFKDDVRVRQGPILAAEFVNNNKSFKAVRYELSEGDANYYSETGASMRKAFIRTPLNFTRISSKFNLNRRHPVLNTIRAHKGVDYAAPSGTPVKAAGDGTITSIGTNGGYGRVIEIKHGGTYSTLYAHLSRFSNGLKRGSRVKQGQTIAYVGMSGLATGPHLHYEFRVNGAHRNPLTVQLPKAESIPENLVADFRNKSVPLLAQLEDVGKDESIMVALRDDDQVETLPENY